VLCRWAFCLSLSEPSVPPNAKIPADSNVEMTWKVFGGRHHEIYLALLKERCLRDGFETDPETLHHQFRLHLHRGVSYLAGNRNLRGIGKLVAMPLDEAA
ncbi:DNA sulfur modification protein DndE, partial [Paracoccus sp. PXZ]